MFTRAGLGAAHALVRSTLQRMPATAWPLLAALVQERQCVADRRISLPFCGGHIGLALFRSRMPGG